MSFKSGRHRDLDAISSDVPEGEVLEADAQRLLRGLAPARVHVCRAQASLRHRNWSVKHTRSCWQWETQWSAAVCVRADGLACRVSHSSLGASLKTTQDRSGAGRASSSSKPSCVGVSATLPRLPCGQQHVVILVRTKGLSPLDTTTCGDPGTKQGGGGQGAGVTMA